MKIIDGYKAKGFMKFSYTAYEDNTAGLTIAVMDVENMFDGEDIGPDTREKLLDEMQKRLVYNTYNLMDGMEFLDAVRKGCITDDDGSINHVFVDGYLSNLGLDHDNLMSGEFLVNELAWEDICKEHTVEVDWVNR